MQTNNLSPIKQPDPITFDAAKKAQQAIQQNNVGKNISINGIQYKYIYTQPVKDAWDKASVCLIDKNNNGLFFTLNGCRVSDACCPIVNGKITTDTCYSINTDDRIISKLFSIIDSIIESPDSPDLKNECCEIFEKLINICRPAIEQHLPQQQINYQTTEFSSPNKEYKVVMKIADGCFSPQDSIQITNTSGNGKIFYSNGNVKPIIKNQIVDNQVEHKEAKIFSQLEMLAKNKQPSIFQLADVFLKKPEIAENNGFKTLALTNGFTISIRVNPKPGQKQSIRITDKNGNGYCYYKDDDYVNPVTGNQTDPKEGKKKGKQYFDQLDKLISEGRYEALNNLCEQLLTHNINHNVDLNLYNISNGVQI